MNAPARDNPRNTVLHVPRVAVLFQRFGPYHISRLDAAARQVSVIGIELSGTDRTYAWESTRGSGEFPRQIVSGDIDAESVRTMLGKVSATLAAARPDVVAIAGWSHPAALAALLWCARNGKPAIVMSDSAAADTLRHPWREAVKRRIVSLYAAALVGGDAHRRYLVALGMDDAGIFDGLDVIDNAHFSEGADRARAYADALRTEQALPARYFLASSRLIAKKNLFALVDAYRAYRATAGALVWDLVILGDGRLMPELRALVAREGLTNCVRLPGFRQYAELPTFYGLAGALVLASTTEQWGLVVNEAMAAGLPVLVSSRCGCSDALVQHGVNGYRFDPHDIGELAQQMRMIAGDPRAAAAMGRVGRATIAAWSPERFAGNLRRAVDHALGAPARTSLVAQAITAGMLFRRERPDD
jgi:1,2-diacylglycerol 3-alpha-glucosyltransferase